ncbi:helix-turn-helix domain-containing protein [Streptomyces sp. TR06-5]|uniref:helix-turn-helix domain-containing protein n=1 Tax=unclassified Streptomyces TaxID=2593676 RepID=UPI0039A0F935
MYSERPSRLGGGTVVWARTVTAQAAPGLVLPDGCMDLLWNDGLLVAGPDTTAYETAETAGTRWTGVRFAPGTGPAVFGVPAHELRDQRVPLEALWPSAEVRRLAEEVAAAPDPGVVLERVAWRRDAPDPLCAPLVEALRQGHGVATAAEATGLSERQLRRRSREAFGYGPKTLARVLRMRHALRLARGGMPLAEVAATAGYADQAHLSRDVRALAGRPLSRLLEPR